MHDHLKNEVRKIIDSDKASIKAYADDIACHAELGYFENRTSDRLARELEALGLTVQRGLARTGLRAELKGATEGPTIAILCELDGIPCPEWPDADKETGASHACGHNLQQAMLLAAAKGLVQSGAARELAGRVIFLAAPAEEFIQIAERNELKTQGSVEFLGGKPELVRLGVFDDIDACMMVHAGGNSPAAKFDLHSRSLGFRAFAVRYEGKAAHAASAPHEGVNALAAAVCGINAVNALRETFKDSDRVRVHYIITKGGDSVNSVPHDVRLEGYVRALTSDAVNQTFEKVRRAFELGGQSVGARCRFTGLPGYLPLNCDDGLNALFGANARNLVPDGAVREHTFFPASTDMGDLSHLMPAIQPEAGGTDGALHAPGFKVTDFDAAVLTPAKALASTAIDFLADGAKEGKRILANFNPLYTKEAYLAMLETCFV